MGKNTLRGLITCFVASLFFFFNMTQVTLFNSISGDLLQFYAITKTELGLLSSAFLLATSLFIIPNSLLLDYVDVKKMALACLALSIIPCFFFSSMPVLWLGILLRFIQGIGCTISLLVGIHAALDWFPKKSATAIGLIAAFGMSGGFFANLFLPKIVAIAGWKATLILSGVLGTLFWLLIWLFFILKEHESKSKGVMQFKLIIKSLRLLYKPQVLRTAFFVALMGVPIYVLGSLWGNQYLQAAKGFSINQAAVTTSSLFLGIIIGSPVLGWISDKIANRKAPMLIAAILGLLLVVLIIFLKDIPYYAAILLFLALGFLIGSQNIGYCVIHESVAKNVSNLANGSVFFVSNGMAALAQPLFGYLMGVQDKLNSVSDNYLFAMLIFPIGFFISSLFVLAIKETCPIKKPMKVKITDHKLAEIFNY